MGAEFMTRVFAASLVAVGLALMPLTAQVNTSKGAGELKSGFHISPWFGESVREQWIEGDVRVLINIPENFDRKRTTKLVIFATPNGNSIENTMGCAKAEGLDWHFDIQHVAAQIRQVRQQRPNENYVLACIEAEGLSWPTWRRNHKDAGAKARRIVEWIRKVVDTPNQVTLTGHSGGGSFVFAYVDGGESIPDDVERISFLDSNYSYAEANSHGDKLLAWLWSDAKHRLTVIAYDDREITLNGKKVVSETGGTFRATDRMLTRFGKDLQLTEGTSGDFRTYSGLDGRAAFFVHPNPENKILHTVLVGEMNGLMKVLIDDTSLGSPRLYSKWVQPAPRIPPRPADAKSGPDFMKSIATLPRAEREDAIAKEVLNGNMPDFQRRFQKVTIKGKDSAGKEHAAVIEVMPDYLCVGSEANFVRVPMNAQTAQRIADAFGCSLPTRKIVDATYQQSVAKLSPIPLTKDRETVETFLHHHELIEQQRIETALGQIVSGIKKDVVLSNRLAEKANRVAIYGWHKIDGTPIQPLNVTHVNWYVDYSHGVRLIKRTVMVDGKPRDIRHVLHDPNLCSLLSDEGPIQFPSY